MQGKGIQVFVFDVDLNGAELSGRVPLRLFVLALVLVSGRLDGCQSFAYGLVTGAGASDSRLGAQRPAADSG
ncbi:hypothetical protein [Streptomyces albipurpureus]|uniref:Uncharacterized protein n=1 Tax=Streptomyces albipurpureus TaxID=2897419 RepID=A0ABT0UN46_9ACTN|nr:hypothetical protein [Streptomyces sp. CWNU-1]MCM2388823.1 hypothetical protein [Streptomyces sp. CWNU-1]